MGKISAFVITALLVLVGLQSFYFLAVPAGSRDEAVVYEVREGAPFGMISHELKAMGLVRSTFGMKVYARLTGTDARIKVGEYALNKGMSPREIMDVLVSGKSITHPITFPEGMNVFEMAELVSERGLGTKEEFLALVRNPSFAQAQLGENLGSVEGYLFPETYNITKYTKIPTLVETMLARFKQVYQEVSAQGGLTLKRHEVVTLASMIEKETGAPEERPTISSVFHNRLAKGMKLQSDPTIIYGLADARGAMISNITKEDILSATKFNTYVVYGLPKGPIANPGKEALMAALHPIQSGFLYFVSRNDGTHVFSETYEAHDAAVKKFQLDRRAREGKSWRDRIKKDNASASK